MLDSWGYWGNIFVFCLESPFRCSLRTYERQSVMLSPVRGHEDGAMGVAEEGDGAGQTPGQEVVPRGGGELQTVTPFPVSIPVGPQNSYKKSLVAVFRTCREQA